MGCLSIRQKNYFPEQLEGGGTLGHPSPRSEASFGKGSRCSRMTAWRTKCSVPRGGTWIRQVWRSPTAADGASSSSRQDLGGTTGRTTNLEKPTARKRSM